MYFLTAFEFLDASFCVYQDLKLNNSCLDQHFWWVVWLESRTWIYSLQPCYTVTLELLYKLVQKVNDLAFWSVSPLVISYCWMLGYFIEFFLLDKLFILLHSCLFRAINYWEHIPDSIRYCQIQHFRGSQNLLYRKYTVDMFLYLPDMKSLPRVSGNKGQGLKRAPLRQTALHM